MRQVRHLLIVLILPIFHSLNAQYDFSAVFPGMEGDQLLEALQDQFKPESVQDFADAKDLMYGVIYNQNDSVSCVYTGHTLYLDPEQDPSQYLYKDGSPDGINAEHTYPRSKGAGFGNAKSDLFNLFPTRTQVNSDRGNLPFGEIPDAQTDHWYYLDDKNSGIPQENIDAYSELSNGTFEAREDHKGNVARAIFYFVTMYAEEVNDADPAYFESMKETLCDWHYYDPVDSSEWFRNQVIATYQSGKENPFILDCGLAARTYCDYVDEACSLVGTKDESTASISNSAIRIHPNPTSSEINILVGPNLFIHNIEVFDLLGNKHQDFTEKQLRNAKMGQNNLVIELNKTFPKGMYLLVISGKTNADSIFRVTNKLLISQ